MLLRRLAAALAVSLGVAATSFAQDKPAVSPKIVIVGDSTAAHYGPNRYPQMGWGQFLGCSLDGKVEVLNLARGGRSTKSFIVEGLFADMLGKVAPGDTVLIQFGHNDRSADKPERYAPPEMFYENLRAYVATVRAKGAVPVLLTPTQTRKFAGGKAQDTHTVYAPLVRRVAQDTRTPLIDISVATQAWIDRAGEAASKSYFLHHTAEDALSAFPKGIADDTHFSEIGARGVAVLVAAELARLQTPASAHVRAGLDPNLPPPRLGGPVCP